MLVRPFGSMEDERPAGRGAPPEFENLRCEIERVGPAEPADNAHRKAASEDGSFVRIMMRSRSNSAKEILDPAPDQADVFGNEEMLLDRGFLGTMDIPSPA